MSIVKQLQRLRRAPAKIPQIASARREFLDWPRLAVLYAGIRQLREPGELRLRGPEPSSVRIWEHGDVHNVWAIFCGGEYRVLESDALIVDVGANVGIFAMYAARRAPAAEVFCYEPVLRTFSRLKEQIARSPFAGRIRCESKGVAGAEGVREIAVGRGADVATLLPTDVADLDRTETIQVTTLEQIVAAVLTRTDRTSVSLLKLDCEGAEWEIFEAVAPATLGAIERICIEYHVRPGYSERWLTERLGQAGFHAHNVNRRPNQTGIVWYDRNPPSP
ncbi:MAG: FkbM family methyltransferase [Pirellulales bacterium]|nr:FkbM family methyltransferase [Pirellulales bacterium]